MNEGDAATNHLQPKIAGNDNLRDDARRIPRVLQALQGLKNVRREKCRPRSKRKKDRRAEPYSRVQDTEESQEPDHGRIVRDGLMRCQEGIQTNVVTLS